MGALSPNNQERQEAERHLQKHLDTNAENLFRAVLQLLRTNKNPQVRMLCAVLMRRRLVNGEPVLFDTLSDQLRATFQRELLKAVVEETTGLARKNICDTIAELAKYLLFRSEWNDLVPFLLGASTGKNENLRVAAYEIFGKVADGNIERLGNHLDKVIASFGNGFRDPSMGVRVATSVALGKVAKDMDLDAKGITKCQAYLAPMLQTVNAAFEQKDEDALQRTIQVMVDIATENARYFKPAMSQLAALVGKIGKHRELEPGLRNACLEILVTVAEGEEALARKCQPFLEQSVFLSMALMLEVPEDPNWVKKDHSVDQGREENTNIEYANMAMDRLAMAIGGRKLNPVVFPAISNCVNKSDWKMRRAGLMTLSQVAEVMELKALPIKEVTKFLKDPHPRVRHAATQCLGQIANDFAPDIQQAFHGMVIPELLRVTVDCRFPRIQTHAAAALFNFVENCEEEILARYVDQLVVQLINILKSGTRPVQEQVLTTIACIAGSAPEAFQKHYDVVMGLVMRALTTANGKANEKLRARAMECVSYIGMAVGKDRFRQYATQLMQLFSRMMQNGFADDDTTKQYMLQAWTRIASCMKEEFQPYLKAVIPHVFEVASKKIEFAKGVVDGRLIMGITSALEEKATACSMLCSFAHDINKGFFPFVERTARVMLPLMDFYLNDEVRTFAISIMPELVQSTVSSLEDGKTNQQFLVNLFRTITERIVFCMEREPDVEVIISLVTGLQNCITKAGPLGKKCLDAKALEVVGKALLKLLIDSQKRIANIEKKRQHEDVDEETLDKLDEKATSVDELCLVAADCIGTLIKSHDVHFLAVFEKLGPLIMDMAHPRRTAMTRKYAVFIIDDLIEYIGRPAGKYFKEILQPLFKYALDPDTALQQASVYGLGVCAEHGGEAFDQHVNNALKTLGEAIQRNRNSQNNGPDRKSATDNAISAFGKICKYRGKATNLAQALPVWLHWLPLQVDESEAEPVYSMLCALVETNNKDLLGPNMKNLPYVVRVLVTVCGTDMVTREISQRIANILKQITKMPDKMLNSLRQQLPQPVQEKMGKILAQVS